MGKWDWLRGKYPNLPIDATYDAVLAQFRDLYRGRPLEELAAALNLHEDQKDLQAKALAETNGYIVALEQLIVSKMETTDVQKIAVGGFTFTPKPEPVPTTEDGGAFLAHVFKEMPEILSVNYQTLRGLVSRALEANQPLPPGIGVNVRTTISRRAV